MKALPLPCCGGLLWVRLPQPPLVVLSGDQRSDPWPVGKGRVESRFEQEDVTPTQHHPYTTSCLRAVLVKSQDIVYEQTWLSCPDQGGWNALQMRFWQLREENKTDFPEQCNGTRQQLHLKEILQGAMLFLRNQYFKNLLNEVHNFLFKKLLEYCIFNKVF